MYSVSGIRDLKVNSSIRTYMYIHTLIHTYMCFIVFIVSQEDFLVRFIGMHIMLGRHIIVFLYMYFVLQNLGVQQWQLEVTLKEEDINITETYQFSKDVLVAHVYVLPTNLSDESISELQNVI